MRNPSAKKFSFYKRRVAGRENTDRGVGKETKRKRGRRRKGEEEGKENRKNSERERREREKGREGITLQLEKGYVLIRGIGETKGNDVTSLLRGPNSNHAKPIAYTVLRVAVAPTRASTHQPLSRPPPVCTPAAGGSGKSEQGEEGRRETALFLSGRSAPSDSELSSCLESQPTKNLASGPNFSA